MELLSLKNGYGECLVSAVIPAYNEESTIELVIKDLIDSSFVSEVLVIDNNSGDHTAELAARAGARVVLETSQGYGCALRRGLDEAKGAIIILTEADGSFCTHDIPKLLAYLDDCDMAVGTRTNRSLIRDGANMGPLVRIINIIFGKLIELMWWNSKTRLTDVGCTFRALKKTSYLNIRHLLHATGPEFAPELTVAMLKTGNIVIEIPVSYGQRHGGESKHSGNFMALSNTAIKMFKTIFKQRLT